MLLKTEQLHGGGAVSIPGDFCVGDFVYNFTALNFGVLVCFVVVTSQRALAPTLSSSGLWRQGLLPYCPAEWTEAPDFVVYYLGS